MTRSEQAALALNLAVNLAHNDDTTEDVVTRAAAYLAFLKAEPDE